MTFNPRAIRLRLKMTHEEMAEYMGWSLRTQYKCESGHKIMSKAETEYMRKAKKPRKPAKK